MVAATRRVADRIGVDVGSSDMVRKAVEAELVRRLSALPEDLQKRLEPFLLEAGDEQE